MNVDDASTHAWSKQKKNQNEQKKPTQILCSMISFSCVFFFLNKSKSWCVHSNLTTKHRKLFLPPRSAKCFIICNNVTWYCRFGVCCASEAKMPARRALSATSDNNKKNIYMKTFLVSRFPLFVRRSLCNSTACNFLYFNCIVFFYFPLSSHTNGIVYPKSSRALADAWAREKCILCFIYIRINPSCCLLNGSTNYGRDLCVCECVLRLRNVFIVEFFCSLWFFALLVQASQTSSDTWTKFSFFFFGCFLSLPLDVVYVHRWMSFESLRFTSSSPRSPNAIA